MALGTHISTDDLRKIVASIAVGQAKYDGDAAWLADAKKRFDALPEGEEREELLALHRRAVEAHDSKKAVA